jgi:COP9 signalosome complex subunit 2
MSDDDFMAEDEDFDFEYSDQEEEPDVDLENQYYNAKSLKQDDPASATDQFLQLIAKEPEKGDWGFKSLKQLVKIAFKKNDFTQVIKHYSRLLTYLNAVTKNYSEKSITNILDNVSTCSDMNFLEEFYTLTLNSLKDSNERLWTKTHLKLAKLWLDRKEYARLTKIIAKLHLSCQNLDGSDNQKQGTMLLEIYALEIEMYNEMKNSKKLKVFVYLIYSRYISNV